GCIPRWWYFKSDRPFGDVDEMKSFIRMISFAAVLASSALVSSGAWAGNCPPGEIEISGIGGTICIPISMCMINPLLCG
ncbi:hypothetical protein, partial [Pseudomonas viridiflava]|uniref:hypothetical protein n=1 Tax=Pseudomonas viridiflava TaxID=33069 RepID=UPI00197D0147